MKNALRGSLAPTVALAVTHLLLPEIAVKLLVELIMELLEIAIH